MVDGWIEKNEKNRWMVGWIEKIYEKMDGKKQMDGWMDRKKNIKKWMVGRKKMITIDGWLDG